MDTKVIEMLHLVIFNSVKKTTNKSGDFKVTHQAPCSIVLFSGRTDRRTRRTDTMCKYNDHLSTGHDGSIIF